MLKKDKFKSQIQATVEENPKEVLSREGVVDQQRMEGTRRMKNARMINVDKIQEDPDQPRKAFPENSLIELSNSIKEHGVLQPITVEYIKDNDYYKIISGERRYRASKLANLKAMPCIVYDDVDIKNRYAKQIIENIQREDLSPIDKARALLEYKGMLGAKSIWAEVEKMVGISETRRKQFIALLNLPEAIQKEIVTIGKKADKNIITEKHARALLMLKDSPEQQCELFELIKTNEKQMTGEEAITKAKEMKGADQVLLFRVTYRTKEELINILEDKLTELKQ
jgi:ParB family transcriptional regulator, chromosome partitioning protein